jgi:2-dehydro-3-deoxy-D-arabinonate dehydratase
MKLFRTKSGPVVENDGRYSQLAQIDWDDLFTRPSLAAALEREIDALGDSASAESVREGDLLAPVNQQEVWAAGVTYYRSRTARMEESQAAGGGSFYDRVYGAERPEIFFKSAGWRVQPSGGEIRIRADSKWNVPEPELALVINSGGQIVGYTIGNDVSSRDIEGENPLYLPQAKSYDGACALGPGILVSDDALPSDTKIEIEIQRGEQTLFDGSTTLDQMKRKPAELVEYLYRETTFPHGCVLMTGTGVVPGDDFTLQSGDEVRITIAPIGTLVNRVA